MKTYRTESIDESGTHTTVWESNSLVVCVRSAKRYETARIVRNSDNCVVAEFVDGSMRNSDLLPE